MMELFLLLLPIIIFAIYKLINFSFRFWLVRKIINDPDGMIELVNLIRSQHAKFLINNSASESQIDSKLLFYAEYDEPNSYWYFYDSKWAFVTKNNDLEAGCADIVDIKQPKDKIVVKITALSEN